jgi:NDMA-dependent alcohol dehydrogenase
MHEPPLDDEGDEEVPVPVETRGAIIREAPGKFEVVDLVSDDPRPGEIQVKLAASGMCHSDDHLATGDIPVAHYPMAGGHEGAGVVTAVGTNTKGFKEGDHVVFSFLPACGRCRWCASGMSYLCDLGAGLLVGARFDDLESFRFSTSDGTPVGQMCGLGTFSGYTTVNAESAVKIPDDIPLEVACLTGCSVGTGWGSSVTAAKVEPGETVIIMGIGGIGANAVQGAAYAGASHVIAVDPVAFKREKAQEFGATETFENIEEAADFARSVTNGQGADKAIVTVGVTTGQHVAQAFSAIIGKGGRVVITGLGDLTDVGIPINPSMLALFTKEIRGALFGDQNPSSDMLKMLRLYQEGKLKLDELITTRYKLDDINQGYEDMHAGKNIRGVIIYD